MTTLEILIAARAKIEKPENWCKGHVAEDSEGEVVLPGKKEACRWSTMGAVWAVGSTSGTLFDAFAFLENAAHGPRSTAIYNYSVNSTHAEALALFDKAIAACGEAA